MAFKIRKRGEEIGATDQVELTVKFKDQYGRPTNADSFPTVSIVDANGRMMWAPTSAGVAQSGEGQYSFIFTVPYDGPYGIFQDNWIGYINGFRVEANLNFVVVGTQVPGPSLDGRPHLGDDVAYEYSDCAIININKLIKSLRARMNSSGLAKSVDGYGNTTYVSCDIFSVDMLVTFLATALWDFNQVPFYTFFNFDDSAFIEQFGAVLVEGATLQALASQALIERGREYQITDSGVSFSPPTVSELMMTQYSALFTAYNEKLKQIKSSLRPHPLGLGVFNANSGAIIPAIKNMQHLRARRIF
jgi:hypothetical protein